PRPACAGSDPPRPVPPSHVCSARGATSAPLFPYTTLFRSLVETLALLAEDRAPRRPQDNSLATYAPKIEREQAAIDWSRTAEQTDRKSTRLNSSHVKSSYAVFCLKKKKGYALTPGRIGAPC